jgi:imidazole glycerol phosphate synthase glutamine amidotransferase subunit
MNSVSIINTGVANIASIQSAFAKLGYETEFIASTQDIDTAKAVVLPGVGAFEAGMSALNLLGLSEPLKQRILEGKPTLAVCLGMQLLCESSEESPGIEGLGVVKGSVKRFSPGIRTPHFGWNMVSGSAYFGSGYAYFANSFRLGEDPGDGWEVATCEHGENFIAAIRKGQVVACQFHPEISGDFGHSILKKWLEGIAW